MQLNAQNIPQELKDLRQWILWKAIKRDDAVAKVPIDIKGKSGAQTHADRWASFDEAVEASHRLRADGLGFAFDPATGVLGVDLDDVLDEGVIALWADTIVKRLNSYTEISPSGHGLHIYIKAELPAGGNRKGDLEIYAAGRFFTFTGNHMPGTPKTVEARQDELNALHREYFPPKAEAPRAAAGTPLDLSDQQLLEKAFANPKTGSNFSALWHGDATAYDADDSRADLALVNFLTFWTGGEEARIERLFRQSALYRKKWDRADYRARTITKAMSGRRDFYSPNGNSKVKSDPENGEVEPMASDDTADSLHRTDMGNSERLVKKYGDYIRFCHNNNSWYVWNGKQWLIDTTGNIERKATKTIRDFYHVAWAHPDKSTREKYGSWALKSEANPRIKAMIDLAKNVLPAEPDEFDSDIWYLNCHNGVVDLRTGNLIDHDPKLMQSKIAPVIYEPHADQTLWLRFLSDATGGDEELMAFLQRAAGYSLTGSVREEVLLFVHGPGAAGKSTFLESLRCAYGDYGSTMNFEVLLQKDYSSGGAGPNAELAKLPGIRLCASEEVDQGKRMAEGLVKSLTGNTQISARQPHAKRPVEFIPQFKLWLVANDAPNVRADDDALWRRILRVPFEHIVPPEKRDRSLKEQLRNPDVGGRAVLAWAVQGCLEWQHQGLNPPEMVVEATDALRQEMNPLADFFRECCLFLPHLRTKTNELRQVYEAWCRENGKKPVNGNRLAEALIRAKCEKTMINYSRGWFGIGLLVSVDDDGQGIRADVSAQNGASNLPNLGLSDPSVYGSAVHMSTALSDEKDPDLRSDQGDVYTGYGTVGKLQPNNGLHESFTNSDVMGVMGVHTEENGTIDKSVTVEEVAVNSEGYASI
jgi:putative DNA primase/helicase